MKTIFIALITLGLIGCVSNKEHLYYDASKSISKDSTVSQAACFNAVGEIAKNASDVVRVSAIALAEKCKIDTVKIQPPHKNLLGF